MYDVEQPIQENLNQPENKPKDNKQKKVGLKKEDYDKFTQIFASFVEDTKDTAGISSLKALKDRFCDFVIGENATRFEKLQYLLDCGFDFYVTESKANTNNRVGDS